MLDIRKSFDSSYYKRVHQRSFINDCVDGWFNGWSVGWSVTQMFDNPHGTPIALLGFVYDLDNINLSFLIG